MCNIKNLSFTNHKPIKPDSDTILSANLATTAYETIHFFNSFSLRHISLQTSLIKNIWMQLSQDLLYN
jgi:hypothetical protein